MMDWTQQMDQMTKQWTEAQKQLWSNWAEATKRGNGTQAKALWQQILASWRTSVHQMLDMQGEGLHAWSESVGSTDLPEPINQWTEQLRQMSKQWTGTQKQLWDNWFQMIEKLEPMASGVGPTLETQPMMKMWQEMTQQALSVQQQWMKNWGSWQPNKRN
jgi:hypothetical protein